MKNKNSKNYDWKIKFSNLEYTLVHPNSIFCVVHIFKRLFNDISKLPSVGCAHRKLPTLTHRYLSSSRATKYLFSLQVDEGIEAMLCCWLQQLQEFGGPEVEKPDLLKGSIGSLKSHPQVKSAGSTSSLARNFLMDPKARYNVSTLRSMACYGTDFSLM